MSVGQPMGTRRQTSVGLVRPLARAWAPASGTSVRLRTLRRNRPHLSSSVANDAPNRAQLAAGWHQAQAGSLSRDELRRDTAPCTHPSSRPPWAPNQDRKTNHHRSPYGPWGGWLRTYSLKVSRKVPLSSDRQVGNRTSTTLQVQFNHSPYG
ncbi:hypothetical protein K474DRAFT_1039003 [Panus rudis PR-1116 ss-1]|nr:hypothetical protein K474DRAFT_1039003 [Panus rudis PR-1116 ss-1]